MKDVEVIKAHNTLSPRARTNFEKRLRVAAYCRVSTDTEDQLNSYKSQVKYYTELIKSKPEWSLAGIYADEAITGTQVKKREDFQRLINDCMNGDVDMVITKSISRFARNTLDTLKYVRMLKDKGVAVFFEEENINTLTMDGELLLVILSSVAQQEVENISANDGVAGIARYLNTHGYVKKLRQNGTIPKFSAVFVRGILDNPIYCGKIAFGRRKVEKKLGTRNEMHVVKQSEFPVYVGQHEAIVSEDDWNLAQTKRQRTTGRREKVRDPDHAHILSGILKCPCCGRNLYGNVSKAHSKDNKTRYYYFCKSIKGQTGHECSFRLNIEQNEINQMVASIVSAMVHDPRFVDAIKEKIGSAVDTSELDRQADAIKAQLRQRLSTKSRLEHQMDTLDFNDPYYDRKALDLQRRYDEQYELIEDMETQLAEIQGQIDDIHQEKITADNIYHLLLAFDEVYNAATEVEQKEFMRAFIERIDIFPEKQPNGNWIRNIVFAFPVPYNGKEIREFPLESQSTVEAVLLLTKLHVERHIEVDVSIDELDVTAAESKAT